MTDSFLPEPVGPILRWAGGKGRLLGTLRRQLPPGFLSGHGRYFEPFFGAGALGLDLMSNSGLSPKRVVINDLNADLINLYRVLQDGGEVFENFWTHYRRICGKLEALEVCGGKKCHGRRRPDETCERDTFYKHIRDKYRPTSASGQSARFLFINRTCFNGLYRVNASGGFNVPFGHLTKPKFFTKTELQLFGELLRRAEIRNLDFVGAVKDAKAGDFVYFDPPYIKVSETSQHTTYNAGGFDMEHQKRLSNLIGDLVSRKVHVLISNSNTEATSELYSGLKLFVTYPKVQRSVSANIASRAVVTEFLGSSYPTNR